MSFQDDQYRLISLSYLQAEIDAMSASLDALRARLMKATGKQKLKRTKREQRPVRSQNGEASGTEVIDLTGD